jgi:hypothetical protein
LSALSTSWRLSLDTMSNEDSWDATAPRLDGQAPGRQAERAGRPLARTRHVANRLAASWAILAMPPSAAVSGRLPEWPKGAVCKTVGFAYPGSNPGPATRSRSSEPVTLDCITGSCVQRERLRRPSAVSRGLWVGRIRSSPGLGGDLFRCHLTCESAGNDVGVPTVLRACRTRWPWAVRGTSSRFAYR